IEHADAADTRFKKLTDGPEPELPQQACQLVRFGFQPTLMAKSIAPGHRRTGLAGGELPRVQIEHDRLLLAEIHAADCAAEQSIGKKPEQPPSTNRQVGAQDPRGPDRELGEARGAAPPDLVWKPQRVRLSVTVVVNRIEAGVVRESLLGEDRVGPRLGPADRKVRGTITDDRLADGRFDLRFRFADIGTELVRALAMDVLMAIPVTGPFVVFSHERPHQAGMRRGNFPEHEEGRSRALAAQQV